MNFITKSEGNPPPHQIDHLKRIKCATCSSLFSCCTFLWCWQCSSGELKEVSTEWRGAKSKARQRQPEKRLLFFPLNSIPARNSPSFRVEGRSGITTSIQRAGEEMPPLTSLYWAFVIHGMVTSEGNLWISFPTIRCLIQQSSVRSATLIVPLLYARHCPSEEAWGQQEMMNT